MQAFQCIHTFVIKIQPYYKFSRLQIEFCLLSFNNYFFKITLTRKHSCVAFLRARKRDNNENKIY